MTQARIRETINRTASVVSSSVSQIMVQNPNRLAFVFFNLSSNVMFLLPAGQATIIRGIRIAPGSGVFFNYKEDLTLPAYPWTAITDAGDSQACLILEVSSEDITCAEAVAKELGL